jgi:hypothetical protein
LFEDNEDEDTQPHDLATLASNLVNSDSVDPQEIFNSICDVPLPDISTQAYNQLPKTTIRLSSLRSMFENEEEEKALNTLNRRCALQIDDEFVVDESDPNYCFSASRSFLDFIMLIGATPGLRVFLQSTPSPSFVAELNLHLPIREFRAKYGSLGFNPTGSMLYFGSIESQHLWIAMAPNTYFDGSGEKFEMNEAHGDTRLSARHYRMVIAFLSTIFAGLEDRHFYYFEEYKVNLGDGQVNFDDNTNLM